MYQTPHFKETRASVLHAAIRENPLGLLIVCDQGEPVANAVPFHLSINEDDNATLNAHLARANPVWKLLAQASPQRVLVAFQGPHAYVTPSWYATKQETGKVVPTWNYVMVQARGRPHIVQDVDALLTHVNTMTDQMESRRQAPWKVSDAPADFITRQLRGIVGLRIEVETMDGKWKMSQNRPTADIEGVRAGLEDEGDHTVAQLVGDTQVIQDI